MPSPGAGSHSTASRYAEIINNKLASSVQKDFYLYVHGYKVIFDNPILVGAEMWHFMGYEGVGIAIGRPRRSSSPISRIRRQRFASARQLSVLLEYLAEETDAERIHIVGYSQGTRLVTEALYNLALMHSD